MTTYTIESADGTTLGDGIQDERQARRAAEWAADRIGAGVYLSDRKSSDSIEISPVGKSEIKKLAREASEAGDEAQYALCVRALGDKDPDARAECGRVIRAARAQGLRTLSRPAATKSGRTRLG